MGEVQDIAQSTVFLFSEGASYITGTILVVDGAAWMNPNFPNYPDIVLNPPSFKL